jgi:hypothetical protein
MQKHYKSFIKVLKESDFLTAIDYKILQARDKHPSIDKRLSSTKLSHVDCTSYNKSYIASWDQKGRLEDFNPNPNYNFDSKYLEGFDFFFKV